MMKREILKLNRKEKRNLIKLINTVNELLDIDNIMKIKSTIKKLNLNHERNANMEFEYGKNFIRIYSMSGEWQVNNEYDDIYFDLILQQEYHNLYIESNCKTPKEYIPKIVTTRIKKGLKYLADNSKEFVRKINLIVVEDRRNVALKEFLPRKYIKI